MPFRNIELSVELINCFKALPKGVVDELKEMSKYWIFPGKVIEKEELDANRDGHSYSLTRKWIAYDDFWEFITRLEPETDLNVLINHLKRKIKRMRDIKKRLKQIGAK